MLKAASYVLQAITVIALASALVVRARTLGPGHSDDSLPSAVHAGLRNVALQWGDEDWGWDWGMPVHKDETVQRSFTVQAADGHRSIEIDNIWGSIDVQGDATGDEVRMDADKRIHAESNAALERAQKEVTLDAEQNPGSLKLKMKYPWDCGGPQCWQFDRPPYAVEMDFRLHVPRDSDLTLKAVNGHEISVRDVSGEFSISNVNGGITMDNIGGSGSAHTVNGSIKATFRENPKSDFQFGSINGSVELYFAKDLSADFRFKTFSGNVYSDFPVAASPASMPEEERHGTKYYFRTSGSGGGRIGAGGPLIRVENLNGDIRILEKHE